MLWIALVTNDCWDESVWLASFAPIAVSTARSPFIWSCARRWYQ